MKYSKKRIILLLFVILFINCAALSQVTSQNFLKGANITSITSQGGFLWVSTYGQGIYKYSLNDDKWTNYSTNNNSAASNFYYCIAASKNYVWAGGADGLYILNIKRNTWLKKTFALGGEMGNWIRSLCYDSTQNVLWIGRFENLTRLEVATQHYSDHVLIQDKDTKTNNFKCIKLDGDSLVWFGTESGVFRYRKKLNIENPRSWLFINNKQSGFRNEGDAVSISDMNFSRDEIWFGTDEFISVEHPKFNIGGIYVYDRKRSWTRISMSDGLPANGIYCLARTGNSIWAAVYYFDKKEKKDYGKGLVLINRINLTVTPMDLNQINIKSSKISSMFFDGWNMWIGTDDGLCKVEIENPLAKWTLKKP